MGEDIYSVLDWSSGRIIPGLTISAVLVTCRVLMSLDHVSFDIMRMVDMKVVTADFEESSNKAWIHNPAPEEYASKDRY